MTRQPGPFPWEDEAEAEPSHETGSAPPADALPTDALPTDAAPTGGAPTDAALTDAAPTDAATAEAPAEAQPPAGPRVPAEDAAPPAAAASAPHRPLVKKEYYAISEVSDLVGLPAHVLRYWESQFSVLNPSKNRSGNRVYQRKEIRLILLVKQLLYDEKYTVEGAKQRLDQLRRGGGLPDATGRALDEQLVGALRSELTTLSELLAPEGT
ncbi:MAG TPA: MerR family transcriptional regulator [Longimicrobiales bacterium]|nr:MerR family transcriptional regulator [Longimicrobiales bacterium]